jgi:hypothetical protein
LFVVWLSDGPNNFSGNVYARNPATGVYGPVCDDFWSQEDVRKKKSRVVRFFLVTTYQNRELYGNVPQN